MTAWVGDDNVALSTDLYELTMAASYFAHGLDEPATFDLFVRSLPERRSFLVACGLEQALAVLETLAFSPRALRYLESLGLFERRFLDHLGRLRFTGEVWAVPEGEVVFAGEPIVRVTAPLIEAQIVETFLLGCVGFQTMVASKAARIAIACDERSFVDFSARRDHGADAALRAARAAYVGGAAATSNALAGMLFGLPLAGTMAHAYVMRFDEEVEAFRSFVADFPQSATLLIDTYDTIEGARRAAVVGREMAARGERLHGVRIDSGDLSALARDVRRVLDQAGLEATRIFASGDLDEHRIGELVAARVPIDAFGVGTQLGTSGDAPSLGVVYKLVECSGAPRLKLSAGKRTLPGRKQVHRLHEGEPVAHDRIALADEEAPAGARPLLELVMVGGRRHGAQRPLADVRAACARSIAALPARLRVLGAGERPYEVRLSERLRKLAGDLARDSAGLSLRERSTGPRPVP